MRRAAGDRFVIGLSTRKVRCPRPSKCHTEPLWYISRVAHEALLSSPHPEDTHEPKESKIKKGGPGLTSAWVVF